MQRRDLLLSAMAMMSCEKAPRSFDQVLPRQAAGVWQRGEVLPLSQLPEPISRLGVQEAAETTYKGAGVVTVRAFRMKAETSAFELMQKWRPADGMAVYKGPYFFVAIPQGTDPQAVGALLRALQQSAS